MSRIYGDVPNSVNIYYCFGCHQYMAYEMYNLITVYLGKLRPYPQTKKRTVLDHIARPEYADDEKGIPYMEQKAKLSSQIHVLSDEEIEGMRVACKVNSLSFVYLFRTVNALYHRPDIKELFIL